MQNALCVADLHQFDAESEPLLHDLRIAERVGYAQPRDIRKLIKRKRKVLQRYGVLRQRGAEVITSHGATHEVEEYWLNRAQAVRLISWCETEEAETATHEVITVFLAWYDGKLQPRSGTHVVWTDGAVREILGHTAENTRAIGELKEGQKRLENKVDNVVDIITNLAPSDSQIRRWM